MASLITSIIGGVQGASAVSNAAKAQITGANTAATGFEGAVSGVNPIITQAAKDAGAKVTLASATAGQQGIDAATAAAKAAADAAAGAGSGVRGAVGDANKLLDPFAQNGIAASNRLNAGMGPGGELSKEFDFSLDPARIAMLDIGQKSIQRALAARGGAQGGAATLAALRYNNAFVSDETGKAFSRFDTNRKFTADTLSSVANRGLAAGSTEGTNLIGGEKYAGDLGFDAAKYGGTATLGATTHAGDLGVHAADYGANADLHAADTTTSNTLGAAKYRADATIAAADAKAQEQLGRANAWNGMLSGIGKVGDSVISNGMSGGWSPSNLFKLPKAA